MASADNLKERFGGLREVSLLKQNIQKIRESTTAVHRGFSGIEDQLTLSFKSLLHS